MATFREPRCVETLMSIFGQAQHPEMVYVGIYQQNYETDQDCLVAALKR